MEQKLFSVGDFPLNPQELNPSVLMDTGLHGATIGLCLYTATEYAPMGDHEDQEGFYVIEGHGHVLLDDVEYPVAPGTTFILPPHVKHGFIRNPNSPPVKVFWFHAAP